MKDIQLLILTLAVVVTVYLGYRELRKLQTQVEEIQKKMESLQSTEPFYAHTPTSPENFHPVQGGSVDNVGLASAIPNDTITSHEVVQEKFSQPSTIPNPKGRTIFGTSLDPEQREKDLESLCMGTGGMYDDDDSISSEKLRNIENLIDKIDTTESPTLDDSTQEGAFGTDDSKKLDKLVENLDPLPTVQREEEEDVFSGDESDSSNEDTDVEEGVVSEVHQSQLQQVNNTTVSDTSEVKEQATDIDTQEVQTLEKETNVVPEIETQNNEALDGTGEKVESNIENSVPESDTEELSDMTYDGLMKKTVKDLRKMASAASVSTKGTKECLVQKLLAQ